MSIYTTPLQFGYFLSLLFALLLWVRGVREERLSDTLLGFVLFFLAMEIQDYTFGFAGINILWERFDGFPRAFPWVFPATIYFYLKAQINRNFSFKKGDIIHLLPYLVYFIINFIIFIQGSAAIEAFRHSKAMHYLHILELLMTWGAYIFYFSRALILYYDYVKWTENQFSDIEAVNLVWLRNFIYLVIAGELFHILWQIIDLFMGDLPYEQDWWWHLFTLIIIIYVSINGYMQAQGQLIKYDKSIAEENMDIDSNEAIYKDKNKDINLILVDKIHYAMNEEHIFLLPELSLTDLAKHLNTNNSVLSATINNNFGKNFNDFINTYRVEAFQKAVLLPTNKHLTLLAIAFDCGFNSKATFNRAYKKATGKSPSDMMR